MDENFKEIRTRSSQSGYRAAFLIIYLGPLPVYFDFWAKSCVYNGKTFHWYVYNDEVDSKIEYNEAVTIIPYTFEALRHDLKKNLEITIPAENRRIVCDCRMLMYEIRKQTDSLEQYDFIGYSDIDVIYGQIGKFMPPGPAQYSMISANKGAPCGPFTLFNRAYIENMVHHDLIKNRLEQNFGDQTYASDIYRSPDMTFAPMSGNSSKDQIAAGINFEHLDESEEISRLAEQYAPTSCSPDPLQPARIKWFNHRKAIAFWENGRLTVVDNRGHIREGAFFHFSRFKNRGRFKIDPEISECDRWGIYKYGIVKIGSIFSKLKMALTMFY